MAQNGKIWEINGVTLALDLSDADVLERYEDAFEAMKKDEAAIPRDGKVSAQIRGYCNMYRNLYDRIFGEGTAARIFEGQPVSSEVYEGVYTNFLDFVSAQMAGVAERRVALISRYKANREQKRAAARQGKKKKS